MRFPWRFALPNMKYLQPQKKWPSTKKTHTKNWMVFMGLASIKPSLKPSHWTVAPPVPRDLPCQRFVFDKFSRSHFDAGFFLPENLTYFLVNFEIHQLKRNKNSRIYIYCPFGSAMFCKNSSETFIWINISYYTPNNMFLSWCHGRRCLNFPIEFQYDRSRYFCFFWPGKKKTKSKSTR